MGQHACSLEDLQVGALVTGVLADAAATVVAARWSGKDAVWLTFRSQDGQVDQIPTGGEHLEVEPIDRLVFTWGDPDAPVEETPTITLTFTPQGERTELVFHLRGYAGKPGDGFVYDGWDQALTNFARHLAGELS